MAKTAKKKTAVKKSHKFKNKLLLNQWLISLFGISPLQEHTLGGRKARPFHILAEPIRGNRQEGLHTDNLHHFYHGLVNSNFFWDDNCQLSREQILVYEENIVRHTQEINKIRKRKVVWKYYQWLTLLFVEIYLDRFFGNKNQLLTELNAYVDQFNEHWQDYENIGGFDEDDLNKLCLQNATGSGKTLLMHVNLLQYRHYANVYGREKDLSRVILITPNKPLSDQHMSEFEESNISVSDFTSEGHGLFTQAGGLDRVDVIEITKLADKEGPNTIATRSLGDQNLLLVDEGHRGMSNKTEEGAWFSRRASLCEKGFTFEYSATFEQAVCDSGHEDNYARNIIFDYSYRWFYEDGFGKDYRILNLPRTYKQVQQNYLTACLLKYYQQLRIYQEREVAFAEFNLEKPLWVFVGSTVSGGKQGKDDQIVATDVAEIIKFIAWFLSDKDAARNTISEIITGRGQDTGLVDKDGIDIFAGAFSYITKKLNDGETIEGMYQDILGRIFNNSSGGTLSLERVKGDSGEISLHAGGEKEPFGLINVGDAKSLCDHIEKLAVQDKISLNVGDSDFAEAVFSSVKDSSSPVNLLIGSKKFVEGWDCWRVSTLGLMHVGKTEGAQIIQLFGRGVRLKGYQWTLKRSGHSGAVRKPVFIEELETLNVFGIEADFMEKFREFLKDEGLPGNESRNIFTVPLNVTYDFGKKLKILRPRKNNALGREYDFKRDGAVPSVNSVPDYILDNKVESDWYPRIQSISSRGDNLAIQKETARLTREHLSFLDFDKLFFEAEQFKREKSMYNLNLDKSDICELFIRADWYRLYIPSARLSPVNFDGIRLLQQVALELLKRYIQKIYDYRKKEFYEPRLEYRELTRDDDNFPADDFYSLIVDGDEEQVITSIKQIQSELKEKKDLLRKAGDLSVCRFNKHLFEPLFHVRSGGQITVLPCSLNESEFKFVADLKTWAEDNSDNLSKDSIELFLLRNLSRGKGVGFFEAGNFHPDFILWTLAGDKQYISFIEPHGLLHEGTASEKVMFYTKIKQIEKRMVDNSVILNSYILSYTEYSLLQWGLVKSEFEARNVFFMEDEMYIHKLMDNIQKQFAKA